MTPILSLKHETVHLTAHCSQEIDSFHTAYTSH